jgi:hypothetical protein
MTFDEIEAALDEFARANARELRDHRSSVTRAWWPAPSGSSPTAPAAGSPRWRWVRSASRATTRATAAGILWEGVVWRGDRGRSLGS